MHTPAISVSDTLSAYFDALAQDPDPEGVREAEASLSNLVEVLEKGEGNQGVDRAAFDLFLQGLAARVDGGQSLAQLELEDLWSAARCQGGDTRALARFDRRCIDTLASVIARIDPSPSFLDEVKQQVRTKLLVAPEPGTAPKIARYAGRGPLAAWVRVVAVREALNLKRGRSGWAGHGGVSSDEMLDVEASVTSPELGLVKAQYRLEFERAFRGAMAELSPEQRNLLRHHYLHGLGVDAIGSIYGLHRSSVARRIKKARATLLATTRRTLALRLATDREDFDRLLALIASRIDLSIERHLQPSSPG